MFTEARKIHLIEEVLKVKSEEVLSKLESILRSSENEKKRPSAKDFTGIIPSREMNKMVKAINEGCEQIDMDGWK